MSAQSRFEGELELARKRAADDPHNEKDHVTVAELEAKVALAESRAAEWKRLMQERKDKRDLRGRSKKFLSWLPRRGRPLLTQHDRGERSNVSELAPYPRDPKFVAATRFGNQMSAMESIGVETYGLDSQTFWYELVDVSSDNMCQALGSARERVDFAVVLLYDNALFLAGAVGTAIWLQLATRHQVAPAIWASGVSFVLFKPVYALLVQATQNWSYVMRGFVNRGRIALAEKEGFSLQPETEHALRLTYATARGSGSAASEARSKLDAFRKATVSVQATAGSAADRPRRPGMSGRR
ncbi:MAG: hypothetical protein ACYDEY_05530 [Acidimicrobiales bacterium]